MRRLPGFLKTVYFHVYIGYNNNRKREGRRIQKGAPRMFTNEVPAGCRLCGTCMQVKPLASFYKDGRDKDGNAKYRRDCRQCYKSTRIEADKRKEKHK